MKIKSNILKKIIYTSTLFFSTAISAIAQYAPAAGEVGSDAIYKDSSVFVGWATECTVERGYIKLSDTSFVFEESNKANHGNDTNALAKADGKVVSLGDSGIALLAFEKPVINGEGADFAVFENSFRSQEPPKNYFLELAFVEVSSDGERFVRFPSVSESQTTTQIETFGQLDPTEIYNLAGKYVVNYGVPFDLDDLQDSSGIDLQNITHIKIIDVVGSVNPKYASYDSQGNIINDPYPTPFAAGGFDLDAVGVINAKNTQTGVVGNTLLAEVNIFPNPYRNGQRLNITLKNIDESPDLITLKLYNISGKLLYNNPITYSKEIEFAIPPLKNGIYLIEIPELNSVKKLIVKE